MKRIICLFAIIFLIFLGWGVIYATDEINQLEKLIEVTDKKTIPDYASINRKNDLLMVTIYDYKVSQGVYWYQKGKVIKKVEDATFGMFSPDGEFYLYVKGKTLYVFDIDDNPITRLALPLKETLESIAWSYDSRYIYICEVGGEYVIYRFDLNTNLFEKLLSSKGYYFHPIAVNDPNIIYLLRNKEPQIAGGNR